MSKTQIHVCIGLLLVVNLALPMLLAPFGLPVGTNAKSLRVGYLAVGASMAHPALAAVWAVLAPQPFLRRGAQALAMLACANLSLDFAMVHNSTSRNQPADMLSIIASLAAFAVCLLPLYLLRARLHWAIAPPEGAPLVCRQDDSQFSLRRMLLGMAFVAALLAASRWLHPGKLATSTLWIHLLRLAGFGLFMGLLGLPVLIVCWLMLSRGGRSRLRWCIGVIGACALAAGAAAAISYDAPGSDFKELVFVLLGMLLSAVLSFWIIRLCGYRLVRQARDGAPHLETFLEAPPAPGRRFAIALCSLILMLTAIASVMPSRFELWREKALQRGWSENDFLASLTEGQITSLTYLSDAVHPIDARVVGRINACGRLQSLSLGPSEAGDKTLASLGELPELAHLYLFVTRITDNGLRQLGRFPNLTEIDLQGTDIGDEGLLALADLERLTEVDVRHTRVTPGGVARLQSARPGLRIKAATDDSSLVNVARRLRPARTVLSRPAGWRPINVRLRAAGPGVTDIGVSALRGVANIEELDLTDARVTDAAVGDLAKLSGLKKLLLRGTQVSESGIARLQRALPRCAIER